MHEITWKFVRFFFFFFNVQCALISFKEFNAYVKNRLLHNLQWCNCVYAYAKLANFIFYASKLEFLYSKFHSSAKKLYNIIHLNVMPIFFIILWWMLFTDEIPDDWFARWCALNIYLLHNLAYRSNLYWFWWWSISYTHTAHTAHTHATNENREVNKRWNYRTNSYIELILNFIDNLCLQMYSNDSSRKMVKSIQIRNQYVWLIIMYIPMLRT